mmetsp:Transcript_15019/g.45354  ORF Transcript_15019/g.45354 Transcript_15019/m.45354 type:complete len:438 (+) Transcript_15019:316-1629(+)
MSQLSGANVRGTPPLRRTARLPHPRAVPPLLEGRNGSSSPDGADGTGSRRRGSSSERSTTTPHAEAPQPHQLWDDTAAALRTPPALDRPMQLPKGSLSQQLRPAGGASSGGSAAEARQAPQDPSPSTSQRQLNHLTEQPGSSAVAAMMDTDEAAGSGGDEKAPSGNQRKATPAGAKLAQHQRKRKASSPLTSVEESVDGEASTSSIGSEVSSASAYGSCPVLVLQTRNLRVRCAVPLQRAPSSLGTPGSLRSAGSFLAALGEDGRRPSLSSAPSVSSGGASCQPYTPRASLCAAMNGVAISPSSGVFSPSMGLPMSPSPGPMPWSASPGAPLRQMSLHQSTPRSAATPLSTSPAEAAAVASFFAANPFSSPQRNKGLSPAEAPVSRGTAPMPIPASPYIKVAPRTQRPSSSLKLSSLDTMLKRISVAEDRTAALRKI